MSRNSKITAARIQHAITGMQIPMLQIVPLYAKLEREIAAGADDHALHATAKLFVEPQLCQCARCTRARIAG